MRFIRQSGRILEDKYVTEGIVAKWCQIELKSPPNEQAKKMAVQLIQHAFRILGRFYNGEDIIKDPDVAVMILNSTYYQSAIVGNQSNYFKCRLMRIAQRCNRLSSGLRAIQTSALSDRIRRFYQAT